MHFLYTKSRWCCLVTQLGCAYRACSVRLEAQLCNELQAVGPSYLETRATSCSSVETVSRSPGPTMGIDNNIRGLMGPPLDNQADIAGHDDRT